MGQARQRQAEIQQLKTRGTQVQLGLRVNTGITGIRPLLESPCGQVRLYDFSQRSLEQFRDLTGGLPCYFETMEQAGLNIADQVVNTQAQEELYVGSWRDVIVEVRGRTSKDSVEHFPIRLGSDEVVRVSRPAYDDQLELTAVEAAFARFALATNHLGWYANHRGESLYLGFGGGTWREDRLFELYQMAIFAGVYQLNMLRVHQFLD